jgi:hypothetical protein
MAIKNQEQANEAMSLMTDIISNPKNAALQAEYQTRLMELFGIEGVPANLEYGVEYNTGRTIDGKPVYAKMIDIAQGGFGSGQTTQFTIAKADISADFDNTGYFRLVDLLLINKPSEFTTIPVHFTQAQPHFGTSVVPGTPAVSPAGAIFQLTAAIPVGLAVHTGSFAVINYQKTA